MLPIVVFIIILIVIAFLACIKIVPQKNAWIVERVGKYHATLNAVLHPILPLLDQVRYKHDLKEVAIDVPPQQCVTRDNITVGIDGILYLQVIDPVRASYGIENYLFACTQLAQTTLRSEVGKIDLDSAFSERASINAAICTELDKASDPWGVKVTRYEIRTIEPPKSVLDAMEKQMRAEREKRASIAESEGERQSRINRAEGEKQEAIAKSEGEMTRRINEAEGRAKEIRLVAEAKAQEIRLVAEATAESVKMVADVIRANPDAATAMNLRVAEAYVKEFGNLAKQGNTLIIPSDLANVAGFVKTAMTAVSATTPKA
ncbi:MAG: SPFH domain-containing protein [Kiritimatiellia bacterium]